jgi:alkylated DNA repair dioxygenase AlkB
MGAMSKRVASRFLLQPDLFGQPLVPDLKTGEAIVGHEEEAELIARIDAEALAPFRFQGWPGKRLTHSFGWSYDFEDGRFAPAEPIPPWLLPLRDRAARFAGLASDALVQALLIRYDPGAGIGWHKDRPVFEHVVGVSLGSYAAMRFRQRLEGGFRRITLPLQPRSVYHLSGEVRHAWEHSIAPLDVPRWSVTFRSLAEARSDR